VRVEPAVSVVGHVAVPGDKSISHRAVMLGAIGEGETRVRGFGRGGDTEATVRAMRALGAGVDEVADDELIVAGQGLRGLVAPADPVDCENAGTLIRLVAGVLAGQEGRFELTGDESAHSLPVDDQLVVTDLVDTNPQCAHRVHRRHRVAAAAEAAHGRLPLAERAEHHGAVRDRLVPGHGHMSDQGNRRLGAH